LRDIFESEITAMHIAEELKYCHPDVDTTKLKETMESLDFDVLGISDGDKINGYVEISDLNGLNAGDYRKTFDATELIADSTPLVDIFPILKVKSRIFVLYGNKVQGIITISDLQKITVRMFLFGLISLLEMKITQIIRNKYKDDTWKQKITDNRLKLAQRLYDGQKLNNENIELIDCLMLSDKNNIILKSKDVMDVIGCEKKYLKKVLNRCLKLRDTLAHSRDLTALNSSKIIDLSIDIDKLIKKLQKYEKET
jgi:hypothetical protein